MVAKRNLPAIVLLSVNVLFFLICSKLTSWQYSQDYNTKMNATLMAIQAQKVIGPMLIGEEYTPITTTLGAHDAKILSTNPDFAAVAVDMLHSAGVHAGDNVAVNMSSSFPALNIAVIAAIDAIGAKPVIVSSVGASTWGANRPDFTWLDMEKMLIDEGVWSWRSSAVGRGGGEDQGNGLTAEGLAMIDVAIERSGVPLIGGSTLADAIQRRIELYKTKNNGSLPKVLVNVGGSHVIFGEHGHDALLRQGLTQGYQPYHPITGGLAAEFINSNRGVIHFININRLAAHYDIHSGEVGHSRVFWSIRVPLYLRVMIAVWIIGVVVCMWYGKQKVWWKL
ncbi:MAG: hypothetical protein H6Q68_556 [Firmicutes bacterium]|nr:hypothetical protein [Bacillota bacterium]